MEVVLAMKGKPSYGTKRLASKISAENDRANAHWYAKVRTGGTEQEIVVNHYFDTFVASFWAGKAVAIPKDPTTAQRLAAEGFKIFADGLRDAGLEF